MADVTASDYRVYEHADACPLCTSPERVVVDRERGRALRWMRAPICVAYQPTNALPFRSTGCLPELPRRSPWTSSVRTVPCRPSRLRAAGRVRPDRRGIASIVSERGAHDSGSDAP